MIKRLFYILINRIFFFFEKRNDSNAFLGAIMVTLLLLYFTLFSILLSFLSLFEIPFKVPSRLTFVIVVIILYFFYLMISKVKNKIINQKIDNVYRANITVLILMFLILIFFIFSVQKNKEVRFLQQKHKNLYQNNRGSFEEDIKKWWSKKK